MQTNSTQFDIVIKLKYAQQAENTRCGVPYNLSR
jgi:hypothetical protein